MHHPCGPHPRLRRLVVLSVLCLIAPALAACGGSTPSATPGAAGNADADAADKAAGAGGAGGRGGDAPSGRGKPADPPGVQPWLRTAVEHRGRIGEEIRIECPARGVLGQVWGTGVYTDDSSICTAAVHVGLITFKEGGEVTIEILEGRSEYIGSTRNDVESIRYGAMDGSFSFPAAEVIDVDTSIAWERPASFYGSKVGSTFTVVCREGGQAGSVWGTGVYTSDSSICTAAVHAGLIDLGQRGEVTFELLAGRSSYDGSTAHGITSRDYDAWESSFAFVR